MPGHADSGAPTCPGRPHRTAGGRYGRPAPLPARTTVTAAILTLAEPNLVPVRSKNMADRPLFSAVLGVASSQVAAEADLAITQMYHAEYRSLVRMAAMLVGDTGTAEEVVQDSFIAMHAAWRRLRDSDKALHYLRRSVVNRSRSVLRHRVVVDRHMPASEPDMPSAEQGAIALIDRSVVIAALRTLPTRQREALVLKFYLDLPEQEVAATMGISRGAVKSHTARGKAALRNVLEAER